MTTRLVIIADDLTGALDTGAPFVRHGLSVAVAASVAGLDKAAGSGADVMVVNTGSRAASAEEAAERVAAAAAVATGLEPEVVFQKIDSRLKGHVGVETATLCARLAPRRVVVAPAVPDQQRLTQHGCVAGSGVDVPIPIAPLFAGLPVPVWIGEAAGDRDLDAIAAKLDRTTLAVGARGLGAALARRFGRPTPAPLITVATPQTLMAVGSRDPITARQIAYLNARHPEIAMLEAEDGAVPPDLPDLPLVLCCTGAVHGGRQAAVAARFAAGVAALVRRHRPEYLWMTGGDTAGALLEALGVSLLTLVGEAAPGVPVVSCSLPSGETLRCVLKSGGFGALDVFEAAAGSAAAPAGAAGPHGSGAAVT